MTDSHRGYIGLAKKFAAHQTVNHTWRMSTRVALNTAEGYFSLLKCGINGTLHHVSKQHLHRYLAEFDFRYNARKTDDNTRTMMATKCVDGKRLQYK